MLGRLFTLVRIATVIALFSFGAFAEDRYVVKVQGDVNAVAKRNGLTVVKSLGGLTSGYYVLSSKGINPQTVLHSLSTEVSVRSAEPDKAVALPGIKSAAGLVHSVTSTSRLSISSTLVRYHNSLVASGYLNQPAVGIINMAAAQKLATGNGAIVATIDTGADFTHPGLAPSLIAGYDVVHSWWLGQEQADVNQETTPILDQETTPILDQETTPILDGGTAIILTQETTPILDQETTPILDGKKYPAYGHGTMVASMIHLVAPDAKIMPVRAFGANGSATISQIVAAIHYAVDHNADVINMSFSITVDSPALRDAINYATDKGLILVAAAGNSGLAATVWPAAYANVMGVAATDNSNIRATWSNYGNALVSLAAPGLGVIAMYPQNHYAKVSGTSFSCPQVAGGAALLIEINKKTNEAIASSALAHAKLIGQELGAGQLDLYQACINLPKKISGDNSGK